jgi:hypothetical protein
MYSGGWCAAGIALINKGRCRPSLRFFLHGLSQSPNDRPIGAWRGHAQSQGPDPSHAVPRPTFPCAAVVRGRGLCGCNLVVGCHAPWRLSGLSRIRQNAADVGCNRLRVRRREPHLRSLASGGFASVFVGRCGRASAARPSENNVRFSSCGRMADWVWTLELSGEPRIEGRARPLQPR